MGKQKVVDKSSDIGEVLAQEVKSHQYTPVDAIREGRGAFLLGIYRGQIAFVDLDKAVVQPLVAAERLYALDKLDERDQIAAKIASGSAVGAKARVSLEVPSGEVWFINRIVVTTPAESGAGVGDVVKANFRIKSWRFPDERTGTEIDDAGRAYWKEPKGDAAGTTNTVDLPAQGELGEELRLGPGDAITLCVELTGANAGADLTATLVPYGRKAKLLVT